MKANSKAATYFHIIIQTPTLNFDMVKRFTWTLRLLSNETRERIF